jgi:hypothetical protein
MAETGALQRALTLADSEVSNRIPQNVSLDMAPKKRSKAQLAAAERGTSTTKNKAAKKQHVDTRTTNDAEAAMPKPPRAFEHVVFRVTRARPARLGVIGHHCPTTTTSSCRIPQQRQQGSRRRTSSRRPTPKVRSRCRRNSATLLHACLASALAHTH